MGMGFLILVQNLSWGSIATRLRWHLVCIHQHRLLRSFSQPLRLHISSRAPQEANPKTYLVGFPLSAFLFVVRPDDVSFLLLSVSPNKEPQTRQKARKRDTPPPTNKLELSLNWSPEFTCFMALTKELFDGTQFDGNQLKNNKTELLNPSGTLCVGAVL